MVNRGKIDFFIDPSILLGNPKKNKKGRPSLFSLPLIQLLLILKIQYKLTYRALEGFSQSTLSLIQAGVILPTYSLICKRAGELDFILPKLSSSKSTTILIDATGIKVYGEGEWKVKVHGASKRRTWIKLHVAVDKKTQEIVRLEVTSSREADCKIGPEIINDLPSSVDTVIGDGGAVLNNSFSTQPIFLQGFYFYLFNTAIKGDLST